MKIGQQDADSRNPKWLSGVLRSTHSPHPQFGSPMPCYPLRHVAIALGALLLAPSLGLAQTAAFDTTRLVDNGPYPPFRVDAYFPLAEALRDGAVDESTRLAVVTVAGQEVALLIDQLAQHHLAQGQLAGEPWMVSF